MPRQFLSAETRDSHRAASSRGGLAVSNARRAEKADGMAAAIAWRESRRCTALVPDPLHPSGTRVCRALAYVPCAHRPGGHFGGEQECPST